MNYLGGLLWFTLVYAWPGLNSLGPVPDAMTKAMGYFEAATSVSYSSLRVL